MDYKGYKLLDKIILVCKAPSDKEDSLGDTSPFMRAYLVDPNSDKQLESARHWASWKEYGPSRRNEETGKWENEYIISHDPIEFEFDNNGFGFSLKDCAGGSSQGGKLSFWNCIVSKDEKEFLIGINSEMLLNVLLEGKFTNGNLEGSVAFVSKKGQCGVVVEGGNSHKDAMGDMKFKKNLSKSMTTKYNPGDNIITTTMDEWYIGNLWKYYEVDIQYIDNWRYGRVDLKNCTIRKLKSPKIVHIITPRIGYRIPKDCSKLSELISGDDFYFMDVVKKLPRRGIGDSPLELDVSPSELGDKVFNAHSTFKREDWQNQSTYSDEYVFERIIRGRLFGISYDEHPLDDAFMSMVKKIGINYVEE